MPVGAGGLRTSLDWERLASLASISRAILTPFCQDAQAAPGLCSVEAVQQGAIPAGPVLELADATLASRPPLDQIGESPGVLDLPAGRRWLSLAGDDHRLDPEG